MIEICPCVFIAIQKLHLGKKLFYVNTVIDGNIEYVKLLSCGKNIYRL